MLRPTSLGRALRRAGTRQNPPTRITASQLARSSAASLQTRQLSASAVRREPRNDEDEQEAATTAASPGESGDHEGRFARTDEGVRIEHPEEENMPSSAPIQGRGGTHNLRTLASFSLQGKVGLVTGGARGLGLVMSQALVTSGADVAIVDMNSPFGR